MTQEVKTRRTVDEFLKDPILPVFQPIEESLIRMAWFAALASVESPGGVVIPPVREWPEWANHIEVRYRGDSESAQCRVKTIAYIDRPLPKTVELTVEEKVFRCVESIYLATENRTRETSWLILVQFLANGKTLDELCQQYGVETKRCV